MTMLEVHSGLGFSGFQMVPSGHPKGSTFESPLAQPAHAAMGMSPYYSLETIPLRRKSSQHE